MERLLLRTKNLFYECPVKEGIAIQRFPLTSSFDRDKIHIIQSELLSVGIHVLI